MNLIIIEDQKLNRKIHIQLEVRNNILFYCGYYYENGEIKFTSEIKEYFNILKMSNNSKIIGISNGYQVYVDYDSGLKHYFKDGKEDYYKFYKNNSIPVSLYSDKEEYVDGRTKKISSKLFNIIVTGYIAIALGTLLNAAGVISVYSPMTYINMNRYVDNENNYMSMNMVADRIDSSPYLSDEEKTLLKDGKFVMDALSYGNGTELDMLLMERLNNLKISGYTNDCETPRGKKTGYYGFDNVLYIYNYDENSDIEDYKPIIAHEYIHLFQADDEYRFICESMATILTKEYFGFEEVGYKEEVKRIKVLMEIVGYEPLLQYNFSGDINPLKEEVQKYLPPEELDNFMRILRINPGYIDTTEDCKIMDEYLRSMYRLKYGESIENNMLIASIYNGGNYTKYYFNSDYINQENCYLTVPLIQDNVDVKDSIGNSLLSNKRRIDIETEGTVMGIIYNPDDKLGFKSFTRDSTNHLIEVITNDDNKELMSEEEGINRGILIKNYVYFKNFDIEALFRDRPLEVDSFYIVYNGDMIPLRDYYNMKTRVYIPTVYEQFGMQEKNITM